MAQGDGERDSGGSRAKGPGALIAAVIIIAVGLVFLLQNMGYALPGNWWALFLLIPGIGALMSASRAPGHPLRGAGRPRTSDRRIMSPLL